MKQLLLFCLLIGSLFAAKAQEKDPTILAVPQAFSLEAAIEFALEHNYKMINASRDIRDAQLQKWETIAGGLPQIEGALS